MILRFPNLTCVYNHLYILSTKTRSSTSVNFHLPIPLLLLNKIIYTILTNTLFLCTSAVFYHPIFAYNNPSNLPQNISLPWPFRLHQRTKELWSLVRNPIVLISPFFLKVWTLITGLTITNSLSLRLRKLVYCR